MAPLFATQSMLLLALFVAVVVAAPQNEGCDCEATCAEIVARQREEIARLESEVRTLRGIMDTAARRAEALSCERDWKVTSDAELFQLKGCRAVHSLDISYVASVADLSGLETAHQIVISNTNLTSLTGLENLTEVTTFTFADNPHVLSLSNLENLQAAEDIAIRNNAALESLQGLENVQSVNRLTISGNPSLVSLSGLQGLEEVKDELTGLTVIGNAELETLAGLGNLAAWKTIHIARNGKLLSLSGLQGLECQELFPSVSRSLIVEDNPSLVTLEGVNCVALYWFTLRRNAKLETLSGLGNLRRASALEIIGNARLSSIVGTHLEYAGDLLFQHCARLTSLRGLGNLAHVTHQLLIENCSALSSLSGLENAVLDSREAAYTFVRIIDNDVLETLSGLNVREVTELWIRSNPKLTSLSGLEGLTRVTGSLEITGNRLLPSVSGLSSLRGAGSLRILDNLPLAKGSFSLTGLMSLQKVQAEFELGGVRGAVMSTDTVGLENLTGVGMLRLSFVQCESGLAGLRNLAFAWGGIFVHNSYLQSWHALRLRETAQIVVDFVQLVSFTWPLAPGGRVNVISWDFWGPWCILPHEFMALVAAPVNKDHSSIAFKPLPAADTCWTAGRSYAGNFTCTRGHPCSLSLAPADGGHSVFVSDVLTGCSACAGKRLQSNVTEGGVVDWGHALGDEEAGSRSICLCVAELHWPTASAVADLLLRGPRQTGDTVCRRGRNCTFKVDGELEPTDRLVLMSHCSKDDPRSVRSFPATRTHDGEFVAPHDPSTWYTLQPTHFRVCWRAACSAAADGPVCPAPEDRYFDVGHVQLLGPYSRDHDRTLGDSLLVPHIGVGIADGDRMRLRRACGEANEGGIGNLEANSSSQVFDFGSLGEDRVRAGVHRLCWCQVFDDMKCSAEQDFMADAGQVRVLCRRGTELRTSLCEKCPAGKQQPGPSLEPCLECPSGKTSVGGEGTCNACPSGMVAELPGSSACVPCRAWESANTEATHCSLNLVVLVLLALFLLSVVAFCALLVHATRRQLSVVDVSLDQNCTIITTFRSHGLSQFGRPAFPVTLYDTGHPGLDTPSERFKARVKDAMRLELLTWGGKSIDRRLDTSMGTLVVDFPHDLLVQGWPVPMALTVPLILAAAVVLGAVLSIEPDITALVLSSAAAVALASTVIAVAVRLRPRATPLARRLEEFTHELARQPATSTCEKGPNRAIAIGKLHKLLQFFSDFIQDRPAYYLDKNILQRLTKARKVSYAELVGPGRVEWFVSHFWGTPFAHFYAALQKHAETACGEHGWKQLHYWVCFCSNNQHVIQQELGEGWQESSFYLTLKSGHCRGTCMVLDDKALPLTRVWCIFELLQTVKLRDSSSTFEGLLLCTSSGVLNTGSGSVDVAMALADKVAGMDLRSAEASNENDAAMIRRQVEQEMGSFTALNSFVSLEVRNMLMRAQHSANQRFDAVIARLGRGPPELKRTFI